MQLGTDAIAVNIFVAVVVPSYFLHWEMRYSHKLHLGTCHLGELSKGAVKCLVSS